MGSVIKYESSVLSIKFADVTNFLWKEKMWSVIKYERSVITKTLLRLAYLVYDLSNCVDDTPIKTSLSFAFRACAATSFSFAFVRVQQPAERYALACDCWHSFFLAARMLNALMRAWQWPAAYGSPRGLGSSHSGCQAYNNDNVCAFDWTIWVQNHTQVHSKFLNN